MQHFFVTPDQVSEDQILLTGSDVNHMKNALRMDAGDTVLVEDGNNNQYLCRILRYETPPERGKAQKDEPKAASQIAVLEILERQTVDTELNSKLYLFQALPKANKMDTIVQKAVELGVFQILPVLTSRCVVKLDEKRSEKRQARWQEIAKSAAKQAGRGYIPKVTQVMSFSDALFCAGSLDHFLLPYELAEDFSPEPEREPGPEHELEHDSEPEYEPAADPEGTKKTGSVMARTRKILSSIRPGQSVGILIGPEGGFELEEVEQAVKAGAQVISLGRRILRTETAGPALLSVLMFELEG